MSPVIALAIGIVWGSILTFALGLAYAAGKQTPPFDPDAQERKAAEDFRPQLHGVTSVAWSHPWSPDVVADAAYREGWNGGRSYRARRPS